MSTPYLEFKYLKNVMISLGNLEQYAIPLTMQMVENPFHADTRPLGLRAARTSDDDALLLLPVFDMEYVHKVTLQDETPALPKKLAGMSQQHHSKLCDQAYERAVAAKNSNDELRRRVHAYVKSGILELVSDPFNPESQPEAPAETAPTPMARRRAAKKVT